MVEFRPFRALHYAPSTAGDLAKLIAPPYDVIDDAYRDRLYERSPHNVIRLILNREADRYAASAQHLADWKAKGILVRDATPCLYLYAQEFSLADGSRHQRCGFITALRLEPFSAGNIRPHERTFARAKEDRLKLVTACRTNLSPLFGVYAGRSAVLGTAREATAGREPWVDVADDDRGRHRVWRIDEPDVIERMKAGLRDATVLIADGHHRYETALAYRDLRRSQGDTDPDAPHNFILMYLTSMDDPGLVVLPTHRIWRGPLPPADEIERRLARHFEIVPIARAGDLAERLGRETGPGCLAISMGEHSLLLRLRDSKALDEALAAVHPTVRRLDVAVLDSFLLQHGLGIDVAKAAQEGQLAYTHDEAEALAATRAGARAVFLLRRPRMSEVEAVCAAGQTMPQKSTYFYPKLLSGLVFHPLD
jgi:uncharacterized protein (DUF1015 family)